MTKIVEFVRKDGTVSYYDWKTGQPALPPHTNNKKDAA